jgi:uncharacterized membrane protein HdeD (DUF308 family)
MTKTQNGPQSAYARVLRTIEAGTASLPDVAWLAASRKLALRIGRPLTVPETSGRIRGLLGILVGVAILVWPDVSLRAMVILVGIYAIADGLLCLIVAIASRPRLGLVAQAVVSLAAGVGTFLVPALSWSALLYVLAIWVIVMGALRLRAALTFAETIRIQWFGAVTALLAIVAGSRVLIVPDAELSSVTINLAIFSIINGVSVIGAASRPRTPMP